VSGYRLVERVPPVEDYNRVRDAAGLGKRDPVAAGMGLPNTLFGVCVERDGRIVGIGRIIGDGGLFFQVVDVAVLPEHQKKGLGARIMQALESWLGENAPPGAYVQLIADEGTPEFYEKYGFRVRTPESSGMSFMTM
jgi:GNAT superfamily N-acetyltransferase